MTPETPAITTWERTPRLRWKTCQPFTSPMNAVRSANGDAYVLEQAWTCRETGETRWEAIPIEL